MKRLLTFFLLAVFFNAASAQTLGGPDVIPPTGQQALSAEAIVKFVRGSEPAQVAAAVAHGQAGATSDLVILAGTLSKAIGLPLHISRVTSGQEFVIGIRTDLLAADIMSRLTARDDVEEVALLDDEPGMQGLTGTLRLRVNLVPGGRTAEALSRTASDAARRSAALTNLTSPLAGETGIPLQTESVRVTRVILSVDLDALTDRLIEGLGKRRDVEYVQRNILLRPLGGSGGTTN